MDVPADIAMAVDAQNAGHFTCENWQTPNSVRSTGTCATANDAKWSTTGGRIPTLVPNIAGRVDALAWRTHRQPSSALNPKQLQTLALYAT
jgi:hypothetical protein